MSRRAAPMPAAPAPTITTSGSAGRAARGGTLASSMGARKDRPRETPLHGVSSALRQAGTSLKSGGGFEEAPCDRRPGLIRSAGGLAHEPDLDRDLDQGSIPGFGAEKRSMMLVQAGFAAWRQVLSPALRR